MTAEQKVKKVYPKAWCQQPRPGTFKVFRIWSDSMNGTQLGEGAHRETWAWSDAAAKIAAEKREAR